MRVNYLGLSVGMKLDDDSRFVLKLRKNDAKMSMIPQFLFKKNFCGLNKRM